MNTLGGPDSEAVWINDAGDIAGSADLPTPGIHDAVIWRHGHIHDLGTLPGDPCSRGRAINARGQVVGGASDCANFLHAFVWEEGGPMRDLNQLISPGSGLQLTKAFNISDRGEILAKSFRVGTAPNDDADLGHLVLLLPCERDDRNDDCSDRDRRDSAGSSSPLAPTVSHSDPDVASAPSLMAKGFDMVWRKGQAPPRLVPAPPSPHPTR